MSDDMIYGAVIVQDAPDLDAVISLLSLRLVNKLHYRRCVHPHELNINQQFKFILLGSLEALQQTVHLYESRGHVPPMILHVAHPSQLANDYEMRFPGVKIIPIGQADLDEMDETLQFLVFETILREVVR